MLNYFWTRQRWGKVTDNQKGLIIFAENNAVMYFVDEDISVIIKEIVSLRKDVTRIKKHLVATPIAFLIGLLLGLLF